MKKTYNVCKMLDCAVICASLNTMKNGILDMKLFNELNFGLVFKSSEQLESIRSYYIDLFDTCYGVGSYANRCKL